MRLNLLKRLALALALLCLTRGAASAEELTLGVFLPQAPLATNAERAAWAEQLARHIERESGGKLRIRTEVFARRDDAQTLSRRVDLVVADGLFAAEASGAILGHFSLNPKVGLFASGATNLRDLKGKAVAYAASGSQDGAFYSNTVLGGELVAATWFSELRDSKDAGSALNMVKTSAVPAAFAPVDHPAARGLTLLAEGGSFATGVLIAMNAARVEPHKDALLAALRTTQGALGPFTPGPGESFTRLKAARGPPKVLSAQPVLTDAAGGRLQAPPIRLNARGAVPRLVVEAVPLPPTELEETF